MTDRPRSYLEVEDNEYELYQIGQEYEFRCRMTSK